MKKVKALNNTLYLCINYSSHGIIRSYDIRMKASRKTEIPTGDVSAISIHTMSDIVAW